MAKNSNYTISEKAQSIIKAINPYNSWGNYNWIIGSLYAMKEDADPEIVRVLKVDVDRFSAEVSSEDIATLRNEYTSVVRYCYDKAKNAQLKIYHDERAWEVPSDIVEFCKKAIDPKPEDYTYIPFAGRCEFGLAFDGKCSGYEVSLYDWAFDRILIDAFGANVELTYSESYCVRPHSDEQFDHIVSVPPFMSTATGTPEKFMAKYFRSLLEEHLKEGGDMCLILPLSATNSVAWKSFREYLVNNSRSFFSIVISLPAIFSPETSTKCCLFLIEKKENPEADLIVFEADGKDFQYSKEPNALSVSLKTETMMETLSIMDERFVKAVSSDVIGGEGSQYSLTPSRFFLEKEFPTLKDGEELIQLGNLISLHEVILTGLTPEDLNPNGTEIYVRFSCLSDNYLSCIVDPAKIEPAPARRGDCFLTEEPGYYTSFLNGVFRVGYIPQRTNNNKSWLLEDPIPTYIGIDQGVFHFRFKSGSAALPNYLLREIMSGYVAAQARRLASGTTRTVLSGPDFLSLYIVVPSVEEQERILERDKIDAVKKAGVDLVELNEKFRKDIHMMKHGLGQTVFNLGNWFQILNRARKTGEGMLNDKDEVGDIVKVKVSDVFDNIGIAIKVLSRQISTFDVGYGMRVSSVSLSDFIDEYIKSHPRPGVKYLFDSSAFRNGSDVDLPIVTDINLELNQVTTSGEYNIPKGTSIDFVEFSEEALSIIIDNIVSNAVAHGFKDNDKDYIVRFELMVEGSNYVLLISNNGRPLPKEADPDDAFVWGKTSGGKDHAGIGCYQIRDLMNNFGGTARIISTPDDMFTVTYELTFTKTNIVE